MGKNFIIFCWVFLSLTSLLMAQKNDSSIPPGEYKIKDIEIMGTDKYSKNQIMRFTGLYSGNTVTIPSNDINSAIKKLWKTNRFSDVVIYAVSYTENEIVLGIKLVPTPQVGEIIYKGVSKSKGEKFSKDYHIALGDRVTDAYKNKVSNNIKSYYKKKGYADAEVDLREDNDGNSLKETLIIDVDKGEKVKIADINISGNDQFSSTRLKTKLKNTKKENPIRFWKASKYDPEKFSEDLQSMTDYMQSEGFRDAKVLDYKVARNSKNKYVIDIDVEEGERYYLGDVNFVGNSVYPTDFLNKVFSYQKGDAFDAVGISKKVDSEQEDDIKSMYSNKGYLFSNVQMIEKSVQNDTINLEIRIKEGEQARWNKVTFDGNRETHDHVIQRSLRTLPGELFSEADFRRTYYELGGMGFFEPAEITYDMEPNPENNTVDIHWKLSEKDASQVQIQGGYGGNTFIGTLGFTFNNFSLSKMFKGGWNGFIPQGDGQSLSLNAQAGQYYRNFSITFTEPWLTGKKPTSLSTSIYYSDIKGRYSENSKLNIFGASTSFNKLLTWPDDYFRFSQGITFQNYKFRDYPFSIGTVQAFNGTSNNLAYFASFGRYSAGPNQIFPENGSDFEVGIKLTPPYSLFSDKDYNTLETTEKYKFLEYYKINTKVNFYKQVVGKLVLRGSALFGFLSYYNRELGPPPFERFYMGGTGLGGNQFDGREIIPLRGYPEYSNFGGVPGQDITPLGGGTVYDKYVFELRYPITMGQPATIFALTFFEAGNIWDDFKYFDPFELKRSAGFGIRVFMQQFGMLGFDFGYGFDPTLYRTGPSGWQTHFIFNQNL